MATAVGSSISIAPGSLSAGSLIRSVLDYIQGGDDAQLHDVALRELNLAIDEVNIHNWRRLVGDQDITLVAADVDYSLNSDFKEPIRANFYLGTTSKMRLSYLDRATFLERFDDTWLNDAPYVYTIDHDARLLVLPSAPTATFI